MLVHTLHHWMLNPGRPSVQAFPAASPRNSVSPLLQRRICQWSVRTRPADIEEARVQIGKSTPASPSKRYDRPRRSGRPGSSSRYAECPLTRPHLATAAAAAFSSSICSSTRTKAWASHGSASGPAAAYPNSSSASSSSARNSGWFTYSIRTTNRCRPAPTHTVKHPSGAAFLRALRHRSSVFMISPVFLPFSMAMASSPKTWLPS